MEESQTTTWDVLYNPLKNGLSTTNLNWWMLDFWSINGTVTTVQQGIAPFLDTFEIPFVSPFRQHRCQAKALAEAHVQLKRLQVRTCHWWILMSWDVVVGFIFFLKHRRLKDRYCQPTAMYFLLLSHLLGDWWKLLIISHLVKDICSWASARNSKKTSWSIDYHWLPIKVNIPPPTSLFVLIFVLYNNDGLRQYQPFSHVWVCFKESVSSTGPIYD